MRLATALAAALVCAGCGTTSSNITVGTGNFTVDPVRQRTALLAVKETPTIPEGGVEVARVDASRCHQSRSQVAPTQADVIADLKIAAYAKGANGIAAVTLTKGYNAGLDCLSVLTGAAVAYTLKN